MQQKTIKKLESEKYKLLVESEKKKSRCGGYTKISKLVEWKVRVWGFYKIKQNEE
jgi:hypothetical protein